MFNKTQYDELPYIRDNQWRGTNLIIHSSNYFVFVAPNSLGNKVTSTTIPCSQSLHWCTHALASKGVTVFQISEVICLLSATSTHFKWELMLYCLHCPTLNKVFLLLLLPLHPVFHLFPHVSLYWVSSYLVNAAKIYPQDNYTLK